MNYMTLAVLIGLAVLDLIVLMFKKGRYWKLSVALLVVGSLVFWYFSEFRSNTCTSDWCSLGNSTAGDLISVGMFALAVALAFFGPKHKKTRRS